MSDDIKIIEHVTLRLARCRLCPYPEKDDKERVLLRVINPENNKKTYAVKCPNIIAPNGQPCINFRFSAVRSVKSGEISRKLSKEILEDLYRDKGKSLQDIAEEFKCTKQMVKILMDRYGLEIRSQSKARLLAIKKGKFENFEHDGIDEDFFSNWSPEMAWVLGLIFTDGCLSGGRVQICSIDLDLLDKVKGHLNSNKPIQKATQLYDNTKFIYRLEFYREKMRNDLAALGLIERKSLTMKFPDVPEEHIRHFIRGCWDGDGSVFISGSKLRASYISGSEHFVKRLVDELHKAGIHLKIIYGNSETTKHTMRFLMAKYPMNQYPLKIHTDIRSKSPTYSIKINAQESLLTLFHYFYDGVDESIYLTRKHNVFAQALSMPLQEFDKLDENNLDKYNQVDAMSSRKKILQIKNNDGKLKCSKCKAVNKLMYVSSDTLCWECLQGLKSKKKIYRKEL